MPASEAKINALIASIRSRADAGDDEAKLAWGTGPAITDPVLNDEVVEGTFPAQKAAWTPLTPYFINDEVSNAGNEYVCIVPGVSAAAPGPTGTGSGIVDGTVIWDFVQAIQGQGGGIRETTGGANAMKAYTQGLADHLIDNGTPPGVIMMYAANAVPLGWLLCDGTAVSRTTFADLFTIIGTTYGVGDGSTTFNLPNFAARFPRGTTGAPSAVGGADTNSHTHSTPNHFHQTEIGWDSANVLYMNGDNPPSSVVEGPQISHTATINNAISQNVRLARTRTDGAGTTGTPSSTENRPAFLEMRFIIKT